MSVADYYATSPGELLGTGLEHFDIPNMKPRDVFECLAHNTNPETGELLRPHARDGQRVGMDFTFNSSKSVGIARELAGKDNKGDPRIEEAHREAVAYAMKHIEADMQTRVRVGGANENRTTGNLIAYRVTHRDTRINPEDQRPDPHLHDHVLVINATFDPVEQKWKAAELGQIKHDAPYYESLFHNRLASNLRDLGYGVRRKGKGFEIEGVSDSLITKFSRRTQYINKIKEKLGITNPETAAKLGATTRLGKAKEMVENLNAYFVSRLTDAEKKQLSNLKGKPSYVSNEQKAVEYALAHEYYRNSVAEERKVYETAIRFGIGSVTPEGIQKEAKKQGLLTVGKEATTQAVLDQEGRIIRFAREGRGTCRPMGSGVPTWPERAVGTPPPATIIGSTLSAEQQVVCKAIWDSTERLQLVIGGAGTGKTHTVKAAIARIKTPVAIMAPTTTARDVLQEDFKDAKTVAGFLGDENAKRAIKNGVIICDEFGLLPIKDLDALCKVAAEQNARIIALGDPKQHTSVVRNGDMFHVLQQYAGLPVSSLQQIRRQTGDYARAVADIRDQNFQKGINTLDQMGWVQYVGEDQVVKATVDKWFANKDKGWDTVISGITHKQNDAINAEIRVRLKEREKLGQDENAFETFKPLSWTEAEKGDRHRYSGDEMLVFHRNSGTYRAGQVVRSGDVDFDNARPEHFNVYERGSINLAVGDNIRFTKNVQTKEGKRLSNGRIDTVKEFTRDGIKLSNGWIVDKDSARFIDYGHAKTSFKVQGRTDPAVISVMSRGAYGAVNSAQAYVDLSRGKFEATVITDMSRQELTDAAARIHKRKSATELMGERRIKAKDWKKKVWSVVRRMKNKVLREKEPEGKTKPKEIGYER